MESGSGERLLNRGENEKNSHEEGNKKENWRNHEEKEPKPKENQGYSIFLIRMREWLINTMPQASYRDDDDEIDLELAIQTYYNFQKIFRIIVAILTFMAITIIGISTMILVQWLDGFSIHPRKAELSDYNVHLVSGGFSLIIMPAYGMLMFRIFPRTDYAKLVKIHMIVLLISSLITIFGVKVAYDSHHVYGPIHLYSLHGWLGITISVLLFFLIISGNWMYFSTREFPRLKVLHRACGMVLFVFSIGASISGLLSRSIHLLRKSSGENKLPTRVALLNILGLLITIFGLLARYLIVEYKFRRRPVPGLEHDDEGTKYVETEPEARSQSDSSNIIVRQSESLNSILSNQEQQENSSHAQIIDVEQIESERNRNQRHFNTGGPRSIISEILPSLRSKTKKT